MQTELHIDMSILDSWSRISYYILSRRADGSTALIADVTKEAAKRMFKNFEFKYSARYTSGYYSKTAIFILI